jgi:hypothetical protein
MKPSTLCLSLLCLAACDGGDKGGIIVDPPMPVIAMDGDWAITGLVRMDGTSPLPATPGAGAQPFRPVHEGMLIHVVDGLVRDDQGNPLFTVWNPAMQNERYVNSADGMFLSFEWVNRGGTPCTWHESIALGARPVQEDRMFGQVTIVSVGDCTTPAPLPAEATGVFQFVLQRVAHPHAGASDR